jgi:group I intron endonuclease
MYIYKVINAKNGKFYIGKTIRPIAVRWNAHVRAAIAGDSSHFHAAIRKWGRESFSVLMIGFARTNEDANILERSFIAESRAMDRSVGYNIMEGGDGWTPGRKMTAEHRRKLSDSHKGKPNSGQFAKGQTSWKKGRPVPQDIRKRISAKVSQSLMGNKRRLGMPHTPEMRERCANHVRTVAHLGFQAMVSKNPDWKVKAKMGQKRFWNNLTPESRKEFLAQRTAAIMAAKQAKKTAV